MMLAQKNIKDIFGKINPPAGLPSGNDALSRFLSTGLRLFFVGAAITAMVYLLWGAFDWITSSGEKEGLNKAQRKIQNALIGFLMIFAVLGLIVTLEQYVFKKKICFGISCSIKLPTVANP